MNDRVEVRVNQVDTREVGQLNDLIEALYGIHSHEFVKQNLQRKDYVVLVEPATTSEIKKVVAAILQIVKADRISIDT